MTTTEKFSTNLRRIREDKDFYLEDLAYATGINIWDVVALEAGDRLPRVRETIQIADALSIPLTDLTDCISEAEVSMT